MQENIKWNTSEAPTRLAVVELCGWSNQKGNATPTGRKIAFASWDDLSPAARRVLNNHGITA